MNRTLVPAILVVALVACGDDTGTGDGGGGITAPIGRLWDSGSSGDTASDTSGPATPCSAGQSRCVAGQRETCEGSAWKSTPCSAGAPACHQGLCKVCVPSKPFCAEPPPGSKSSVALLQCDQAGEKAEIAQLCTPGVCKEGACRICKAGEYRCEGAKREVCAGGGRLWSPDHCPKSKPVCIAGKCFKCTPGAKLCSEPVAEQPSKNVLLCDEDGIEVTPIDTCTGQSFCHQGACVTCAAGTTACQQGQLATCAEDGQSWQLMDCPGIAPTCHQGACQLCSNDAVHCRVASDGSPASVMKCGPQGKTASVVKTCSGGQVCHGAACKACAPGLAVCHGPVVVACLGDGSGSAGAQSCHAQNLQCSDGGCGCPPGKDFCSPPAIGTQRSHRALTCNGSGKGGLVKKTCSEKSGCVSGACVECAPGARRCVGSKALVCKADGSGWQVNKNCASFGLPCAAGVCLNACHINADNPTNRGCQFFAVDLDNASIKVGGKLFDAQNSPFGVMLVNESPASVKVILSRLPIVAGQPSKTGVVMVPTKTSLLVKLPLAAWGPAQANQNGTSAKGQSYRIQSTKPIGVYQFNPLQTSNAFSGDSSMLRPVNAIGKEYLVMTRKQTSATMRGFVAVVATRPGKTKVTVTASAQTLAGGGIKSLKKGESASVSLTLGQVLNIESGANGADLTGTRVVSSQPVAVFAGSEAAHSPNTDVCLAVPGGGACNGTGKACKVDGDCVETCCADHLEEQLPPVSAWGKIHVATRLQARGKEQDTWRILAAQDGTKVFRVPSVVPMATLDSGQWLEFNTKSDLLIVANKPVLVGQFMASSALTGNGAAGDPAMMFATPVTSLGERYHFGVPTHYAKSFISIATPEGGKVTLDSQAIALPLTIPGTGWRVTRVQVKPGYHTLQGTLAMAVTLHGWSDGVSYGHSAGHGWR